MNEISDIFLMSKIFQIRTFLEEMTSLVKCLYKNIFSSIKRWRSSLILILLYHKYLFVNSVLLDVAFSIHPGDDIVSRNFSIFLVISEMYSINSLHN